MQHYKISLGSSVISTQEFDLLSCWVSKREQGKITQKTVWIVNSAHISSGMTQRQGSTLHTMLANEDRTTMCQVF